MKQLNSKVTLLFFLSNLRGLVAFFLFWWIFFIFIWIKGEIEVGEAFFEKLLFWSAAISIFVPTTVSYVWARLTYRFFLYEISDNELRVESGVVTKNYVTIPYNRIQNVNIYRDIISRIFGLSTLYIQTAGTGGVEAVLPGLLREDAEVLRAELLRRGERLAGQQKIINNS